MDIGTIIKTITIEPKPMELPVEEPKTTEDPKVDKPIEEPVPA